jgi:hypothetical protein
MVQGMGVIIQIILQVVMGVAEVVTVLALVAQLLE